ncbi:ead/Ea22-like family protein [Citrobacter portucalensis]|uniref:ead/Ea22-like family protein n=1 Tax=Citrobacter portucalensis TaxID=1639133 RepID=UPI0040331606
MTAINKQALRERYSPHPVPKCHICGAEMAVQRMSTNRITYGCTGATYDEKGCHYAAGRSIADDHYEQSRVTVVDVSDPDVLAMLDELEKEKGYASAYEGEKWHYHQLAESEGERANRAEAKLEAAEKRIAELEARTVTLPPLAPENLASVLDGYEKWLIATTFRDTWNACLSEVMRMNAAGIGVKGE